MRLLIVTAVLVAATACSHDCQPDHFDCNGECFSEDSIVESCGIGAACRLGPCVLDPLPANTTPFCADRVAGLCGAACVRLFGDCNHSMDDGCETPLGTDSNNCGGCNSVCHGTCNDGFCTTLMSDSELSPSGLVVTVAGAYWTARQGTTLQLRLGHLDGTPPSLVASFDTADGVPAALAQAGDDILVATGAAQSTDGGSGAVYLVHPDGGFFQIATGQDAPGAVTSSADAVFWTNYGGGQVMRASLDGGTPQQLADSQLHPRAVEVADQDLFWVNEGSGQNGGSVVNLPLDGGASAAISTAAADGTATAAAPVGLGIIRTLSDPLATSYTVRVVAWADGASGVVWGSKGSTPFPLTHPGSVSNPRALSGGLETLYVLDSRGLSLFDRLFIEGNTAYAPPFNLFTIVPMRIPIASAEAGLAWIDGASVWYGPALVSK
jgi:hypothetical protein